MMTTWLSLCCTFLIANSPNIYSYTLTGMCYFITGFYFYKDYGKKRDEVVQQSITNFIVKAATVIQLIRGASSITDWICNIALIYKQFDDREIEILERGLDFVRGNTERFTAASDGFAFSRSLDNLEDKWKFFKTLKDSQLYDSTKKFGMYFIISGCSSILGEEINESALFSEIKKRGHKRLSKMQEEDILIDIIDTTISLVRTWHTITVSDNVYKALKSKDEILQFVTEYEEIMDVFNTKTIAQMNQIEMDKKLRNIISVGLRLRGGAFSNRIASMLSDLKTHHKNLLVQLANNGIRSLPFGILLYGPSGIGNLI
jgi:hypothetical protein